ncbi:MAG: UDP-N-acetylglucosamine--N-acetylmuramyl-(pentapeptide) pyrophosphoryl-undecaprenol N-acetylglucosamine transferase [Candidatus Binatia bacterium]|nr:MAG: UDP-N-acetylglucosamine--N-acetylmuramyl-(pentapeptide) pyrophosphoryl-undecaprenol N-acetylglucosamine transferase [Candidatus Binatia bacterium]
MMRLVLAGGGTGGHLFPGLALAERWVETTGSEVLFIGSVHGLEAKVVPQKGYPFVALPIKGARGRGWRGWLEFAFQLPSSYWRASRTLRQFTPRVVVGLGSYGSVPVILAAWRRRIPVVLLEQNAHPGLANRLLGRLAWRVCTAFEEAGRFFPPEKSVYTGNPVRALGGTPNQRRNDSEGFHVLVFGGSQGARSINRAMVEAVRILRTRRLPLSLLHQTGAADEQWVRREYAELGVPARVYAFIDDMASAYAEADLVVCRAGATTLAELATVGKPAILVPYPFAADDHQRANAEVWVAHGAAEMILDAELSGEALARKIEDLMSDPQRREILARNALRLARPDATNRVLEVCAEVGRRG